MGETIPPESTSQPAAARCEDPHASVTYAPPAATLGGAPHLPTFVPSWSDRSDARFQSALDASARGDSSLRELKELVAELSSGMAGAKRESDKLERELSTLRALLGSLREQQILLQHRVAELERERSALQHAGERERQSLVEPHDRPLAVGEPPPSRRIEPAPTEPSSAPSASPAFGPPPSPPRRPEGAPAGVQSAASLPHGLPTLPPVLKQKAPPATRPLIDYSLGEGGVQSELLEGARISSKPPRR